jgi:hypothetical protein
LFGRRLGAIAAFLAVGALSSGPAAAQSTFTDVTDAAGVGVAPRQTFGHPIWADVNGEGSLDVYVGNHGMAPSLFRNDGDGTFTDRRRPAGIAARGDRHGAAWGDYDNDGRPDLFVTLGAERGASAGQKTDQLYHNDGQLSFTDVTANAGVANAFGRGRSVNWVDVDNDGHLDLFVKNHQSPNVLYRNNGDGTFTDVAPAAGLAAAPGTVSSWADYDRDGRMDLLITAPTGPDQLWRNNGDGTFTEVTVPAGLGALANGGGIAWGDYDGDGYPDVYIARSAGSNKDRLSVDASTIVFSGEEIRKQNGLDFAVAGTSITVDLFINGCRDASKVFLGRAKSPVAQLPMTVTAAQAQGKPDYVVGTDLGFYIWKNASGWHIRWTSNGRAGPEDGQTFDGVITAQVASVTWLRAPAPPPSGGGTLLRNNGDGTFTDVTAAAGVVPGSNSRAAIWGDVDNDGHLDLYVVARSGPNHLYRNNGDGTFTDVAAAAGIQALTGALGEGAAWGDFDNDGSLDLYLTHVGPDTLGTPGPPVNKSQEGSTGCLPFGRHALHRNGGNANHWLKIRLVGTVSNRDGIGAKVTVSADGHVQSRESNGSGGGQLFSQGAGPLHVGLGSAVVADAVTVEWPSGRVDVLTDVRADQQITVVESR